MEEQSASFLCRLVCEGAPRPPSSCRSRHIQKSCRWLFPLPSPSPFSPPTPAFPLPLVFRRGEGEDVGSGVGVGGSLAVKRRPRETTQSARAHTCESTIGGRVVGSRCCDNKGAAERNSCGRHGQKDGSPGEQRVLTDLWGCVWGGGRLRGRGTESGLLLPPAKHGRAFVRRCRPLRCPTPLPVPPLFPSPPIRSFSYMFMFLTHPTQHRVDRRAFPEPCNPRARLVGNQTCAQICSRVSHKRLPSALVRFTEYCTSIEADYVPSGGLKRLP